MHIALEVGSNAKSRNKISNRVGSGELRLKENFKSLEVSPEKWGKMCEDQRKRALEQVHGVPLGQLSTSAVENITKFLSTLAEPTVSEMINASIDWFRKELLSTMVKQSDVWQAKVEKSLPKEMTHTLFHPILMLENLTSLMFIPTERSNVMIIALAIHPRRYVGIQLLLA